MSNPIFLSDDKKWLEHYVGKAVQKPKKERKRKKKYNINVISPSEQFVQQAKVESENEKDVATSRPPNIDYKSSGKKSNKQIVQKVNRKRKQKDIFD
mgnify:CR=1 FL=1